MSSTKIQARLVETKNGVYHGEFVTRTGETIKTAPGSKGEAFINLAQLEQYKANPVRVNLQ